MASHRVSARRAIESRRAGNPSRAAWRGLRLSKWVVLLFVPALLVAIALLPEVATSFPLRIINRAFG